MKSSLVQLKTAPASGSREKEREPEMSLFKLIQQVEQWSDKNPVANAQYIRITLSLSVRPISRQVHSNDPSVVPKQGILVLSSPGLQE